MKNISKQKSVSQLSLTGESGQTDTEISGKTLNKRLSLNISQCCNPYKFLPNCRKFEIQLGKPDELFEIFGIFERQKEAGSHLLDLEKKYKAIHVTKRHPPKIVIHPLGNKAMNRFIEHYVIRLNELAKTGDGKTFFTYAQEILRSDAVLVMAINHVFPQ